MLDVLTRLSQIGLAIAIISSSGFSRRFII
jgi:hypothetical protein